MSQPVKLSDALVLDARLTSEVAERSIAGQIEFWARLGRAIEPLLSGEKALALRKSGDAVPLSELLSSVDSPAGRKRVADYLAHQPFPHYEPAPDRANLLVRIEQDGTRTVGRFVNRRFQAVKTSANSAKASERIQLKEIGKKSAKAKNSTKTVATKRKSKTSAPSKRTPSRKRKR